MEAVFCELSPHNNPHYSISLEILNNRQQSRCVLEPSSLKARVHYDTVTS